MVIPQVMSGNFIGNKRPIATMSDNQIVREVYIEY